MNRLLEYYITVVEHPGVSGFEHLEMLMMRDKLANVEHTLLPAEKEQLEQADYGLIARAGEFYAELARITDLQYERERRQVPPSHWWWYLDVLAQIPSLPVRRPEPTLMPA